MVDNSILIVDKKTYLVIDKIECDGCKYIYFGNKDDENDFFIRKEVTKEDNKLLVVIDNEEEFFKTLRLFAEKNK